ncbi:MAG: radical SAM protein, partial [Candidatus Eisenbacteria bacterium]|nr:radical SAM protein [Candidatus Eisenbacteria bacterium]
MKLVVLRELTTLVASQGLLRRAVLGAVSTRAHKMIVEENRHDRPLQVRRDVYDHLMALIRGIDRATEMGCVSKRVVRRIFDIFFGNILLRSTEDEDVVGSLGFTPPKFLLISPTGRCNLSCSDCYADSGPGDCAGLDFETFDRLLTEKHDLWGSHFTVISGGEPFLWRDGGRDLVDMAARHDDDLFMVYTNGTLIDDDTARRMAELGNVTPAISVEGFEEKTDARRGRGTHMKVLAAFANLRRHGVPFGVSATPTRDTWDIITSDEFVDFYFEEQCAVYGWLFQYMPVGRGHILESMVPPRERVEMLRRMRRHVRERQVFLADFWNSGPTSCGCIAAGRRGGYFHVDWNGDVTPCAFVPYSTDNINDIYARGGSLNDALGSPLFTRIREWQARYGFTQ